MASLSIRDLDDDVRERLRRRAARNGRSTEAEVRAILTAAVAGPFEGMNLGEALLASFGGAGIGVDLEIPRLDDRPGVIDFDGADPTP